MYSPSKSTTGRLPAMRYYLLPLVFLMLVGVACSVSMPGLTGSKTTPTGVPNTAPAVEPSGGTVPTAASAQVIQPTALPDLPPALVEVNPLPDSELTPKTTPVFFFNQPMERASVEAAFAFEPGQPGRFEWLDDATVRFVPDAGVDALTGLEVTIGASAKAANGQALREPVAVRFQPAGMLLPAERLPLPEAKEVNPSSAVVVTFNRPVVALGAEDALPPAFTLEPAAPGRGEWLNTSTYIFYPEPALSGGAQYTVRLNSQLTSTEGIALDTNSGMEWSFSTAAPQLLSITPTTERPILLDSPLVMAFNQPMDRASVEAEFSLDRQNGGAVEGTFTWNEEGTEVTFKPAALLERGAAYSLLVSGAARSLGGAPLGENFAAVLTTVPQFAVVTSRPTAGEALETFGGSGGVGLTFSSPVAPGQDLEALFSIRPEIVGMSINRSFDGSQVFVSGFFQPAASYTLTAAPELLDRWGATLGVPYSLTFSTKPPAPSLMIPAFMMGTQSIFIPSNEVSLPVNAASIDGLDIKRGSLTLDQYLRADATFEGLQNWRPLVNEEWTTPLNLEEYTEESVDVPLSPDWTALDSGLYFLKIDAQPELNDGGGETPPLLLVVSPVQMTLKTSARQAFVWAVRAADNQPLVNAHIVFYDGETATVIGNCITDPDGKCQTDLPLRADIYKPIYAVVGQPGDPDFSLAASNWTQGVTAWDFRLSYLNEGGEPEIYIYTDRPIYRPGQTVSYRVIARDKDNARYGAAPFPSLSVDVGSPYDPFTGQSQVLATHNLSLDTFGAASGTYVLPDDASPGTYSLRIQQVQFREINFEVAEYRKPEIDLSAAFVETDVLAGSDLQARVTARYFFGAPAGNLPVHWSITRARAWEDLPDNLTAGPLDLSWMNAWESFGGQDMYVWDGQAQTGPDGTLNLTIPGQELRDRLGDAGSLTQTLRLEVTVEDESGLPVSARGTIQMHPTTYLIGLRSESWNGEAGREMTYTVRSLDWAGGPLAEKPLTARFSKVTWKQAETAGYEFPTWSMDTATIGSTDFRTSPDGDARLAFTPQEPGTYLLEVTGEDGVISQVLTWVSGPGSTSWPELPNQRLRLSSDRSSPSGEPGKYKPGETARIFIPNPFTDGATALITVERGKVMRSSVIPINAASYQLDLPLTNADAPNIYVSVLLMGRTGGRPDFRMGYVELEVDPSSLLLDLAVETSPAQPQPGGDVTITLRAKDADGKPVQGAFSLALVDKAVLALKDPNVEPLVEAFYGSQPLGVQSSLALVAYSGRFVYMPPGRGGGGGGDLTGPATVRSRFEDTAYWNGALYTDVTGIAQITLTLPDNLTTWQADARGLTADALVGQVQSDIVVGKPLLISPVVPGFAVAGDHLEMAAVVHNNTTSAHSASVRLESVGFTLDDLNQTAQPVDLQPGERRRVSWWGTVQNIPSLDLTFSVETSVAAGGTPLRDATRPENNPLPVLRYSSPQTFGTSGILSEAGERMELTSLPRSFSPTGGELNVELSPSLTAAVLDGLKALEYYPSDFTEPVISRLLPNLAAHQALREFQLEDEALLTSLETAITDGVQYLSRAQNTDGGWGWAPGYKSDPYISTCVLLGLSRAARQGAFVSPDALRKAQEYLLTSFSEPSAQILAWQLDRQAFRFFVLQDSGRTDLNIDPLYGFRDKLSPWGKAFLAIVIEGQTPGDERARTLLSDLQSSASRSATGANWQDASPIFHNWSTPAFTTAVVAYAVARLDPASPLLADAVRYLMLNRQPNGAWSSSFDTSWALLALIEMMRGTGGVQAGYTYSATLNGSPLMQGQIQSPAQAVNPVISNVPLGSLRPNAPNALVIQRGEGEGRLFYRAFLRVDRPAEDAPPVQRGMTITRQYYLAGQDCRAEACQPLTEVDLTNPQPVQVRLTLTVPEDMAFVIVEDTIPAGAEVLNPRLKTSQQNIVPEAPVEGQPAADETPYDPQNPFREGWGWWRFRDPQAYDDHVRWVVESLPAGTYELTYRLTPYLAGEFRVLPARAWQHYFPEVQAASKGEILVIR